mgnify:FL=1
MYATVTDWETEAPTTPESFCEQVEVAFQDFKGVGATSLRFVKTGDNTARTMTMWPDEETASFAIEAIEAVGSSLAGVKFVASAKGLVLGDFT